MLQTVNRQYKFLLMSYIEDWNKFAVDMLGVSLDKDQQRILDSVQRNPVTHVRSGHARGKDYIAAVAALCHTYLRVPSKTIITAPTQRQVRHIVLAEVRKIHDESPAPLGGRALRDGIFFGDPTWYMLGFRAKDKRQSDWTGFHGQHVFVILSEAQGIDTETYESVNGLLTGDSRLLFVGNPLFGFGGFYSESQDTYNKRIVLSCLEAPNVKAKKTVFPGQVDYTWVARMVSKPGLTREIQKHEVDPKKGDFKWEGKYYRPSDIFRTRVMGQFPEESEGQLIPHSWVEAANERWIAIQKDNNFTKERARVIGVDVAGLGRNRTCLVFRHCDYVPEIRYSERQSLMRTAHIIRDLINCKIPTTVNIDTIGEGAGVQSRLEEMEVEGSISAKFSCGADNLTDKTGLREFVNMRAFCYWRIRDELDPEQDGTLALPVDDDLKQELTEIKWKFTTSASGKIIMEPKEDIIKRIGRSPDGADGLALSYFEDIGSEFYIGMGNKVDPKP